MMIWENNNMILKKVLVKIKWIVINIFVIIVNVFIPRDKSVILVGAWMGTKFADNSRYIYQYLFENKQKYDIKKVVWVTRNAKLNQQLNEIGYESYLIGTTKSFYYHIKSGIHIVCDASVPFDKFYSDIDSKYSWGAIKIQLWHGVGIKSPGKSNRENKISLFLRKNLNDLYSMLGCGAWNSKMHVLATCDSQMKVLVNHFKITEKQFIISCYPRNCDCISLLDTEKKVIQYIKRYNKVICYLPTFRENYIKYIHPLKDDKVIKYLNDNNILWIEKQHTASEYKMNDNGKKKNIFLLKSDFDINVLYQYIDIVISDYSSAAFDAINKDIPVIFYVPDLELYNKERGFVFDFDTYCVGKKVYQLSDLKNAIDFALSKRFFDNKMRQDYDFVKQELFEVQENTYERFMEDMQKHFA